LTLPAILILNFRLLAHEDIVREFNLSAETPLLHTIRPDCDLPATAFPQRLDPNMSAHPHNMDMSGTKDGIIAELMQEISDVKLALAHAENELYISRLEGEYWKAENEKLKKILAEKKKVKHVFRRILAVRSKKDEDCKNAQRDHQGDV
jgi:hypothetical protein